MSLQKFHSFEKTSIQLRHTMKRLEVFLEVTRDEQELALAKEILKKIKEIRNMIPEQYQDVDIKEKEKWYAVS